MRVSVSWPVTPSSTVRSSTPFCRPMLTNVVAWWRSTVLSCISAMQMLDAGAVSAWIDMDASVELGSSDTMRTVESPQPTARYAVRCRPSGHSGMLIVSTGAPIALRSWYSFSCPSMSSSKYTSSLLLSATTTWRSLVHVATIVVCRPLGRLGVTHSLICLSTKM